MKTCLRLLICHLALGVLCAGFTSQLAVAAASDPFALAPVGETKPFHGVLRAKDLRLGTLGLGSSRTASISRILALDPQSRLLKGVYPATLAEFALGDVIEGFAFPDQHGRMVVAVATAKARPLTAAESRSTRTPKMRKAKSSGGGRRVSPKAAPDPVSESRSTPLMTPAEKNVSKPRTLPAPKAAPRPRTKKEKSQPAAAKK